MARFEQFDKKVYAAIARMARDSEWAQVWRGDDGRYGATEDVNPGYGPEMVANIAQGHHTAESIEDVILRSGKW